MRGGEEVKINEGREGRWEGEEEEVKVRRID